MADFNERHNISSDKVVFCYQQGDADSLEVANYYAAAREVPSENLVPLPCASDNLISEADFITTIQTPLTAALSTLNAGSSSGGTSSSGEKNIWVIIFGYHVPHAFTSGSGEIIAVASAAHKIGTTTVEKFPNITYDRRGSWQYFDVDDANEMYITAVIDGPTKESAMALIDRSIAVDNSPFVTGKVYVDPYGLKISDDQLDYQADILDWVQNSMNGLGLQSEITVDIGDPYRDPMVQFFQSDSFYWGWYTPRFSRLLFLNQSQKRAFLYNADDDAAADITLGFDANGSDPWCNIAIGIDPGYASCAGAVDAPGEDAYLRPRPFFESMHRGASLGECFLYSSPYINWKIILIGDPLMVVNFPNEVPPDQDLSNESLPNTEVIRRVVVYLEQAIAYATRQYNLLDTTLTAVVDSSNFSEELHLLVPVSNWKDMKSLSSRNQLFARPATGLLNYVLTTEGMTFEDWLDLHDEKISQLLSDVIDSAEGDSVSEDYIYTEGHWNYDFVYTHVRSVLENVHFRLQIAEDEDFTSIVVDANSYGSIDGWQYESEAFGGFIQMISEGFPSNYSGRRIRYEAVEANYLTQTELYYVRWRPLDSNGNNLTSDWFTDDHRMIVAR